MHECIRVAVIDDHPLFRDGVVHTLRSAPDIEVVAEGATAQDAMEIGRRHTPHIMLLDISMPGCGLEAAREIRRECPNVKAVMLTASENENHVQMALQYGVNGYVVKGCSGPELLRIVRTVQNCESYITPALAARLLTQRKKPASDASTPVIAASLTHREDQVLQLLSQGLMNKEIAYKLQLTEKTVKHYMTALMQKLNARNRVEAVLISRKRADGQNSLANVEFAGNVTVDAR
jgi:two-component system nitrate/nitrite response regulator NarL